MGAHTPVFQRRGPNASDGVETATINPQKPAVATGLLEGALEGQDDDVNGEVDGKDGGDVKPKSQKGNRKRNKDHKKKNKKLTAQQSVPPRVALADIFKEKPYPEGQIVNYTDREENLQRTTDEEVRHLSVIGNMDDDFLSDYRKAAEVHRQVRQYVQNITKPGVTMNQLADEIEDGVRSLVGHQATETGNALKAGMGFPTGLCLNNVVAHWTPNPGQKEIVLQHDDVLSVDFGVHVNGRIVDSAFTIAHNPIYDDLLEGVKTATETGLKEAGIDARMDHISACIQEVMESYEVTLNGKTAPIKPIYGITGHNILRYKIHGSKQVPFVKTKTDQRMEEGDVFAIETFGSTGRGTIRDAPGIYGYGLSSNASAASRRTLLHTSAKSLLKLIDDNFSTLVFSRRYLERLGAKNYHLGMKTLVEKGIVEQYAPLVEIPGSYVAQFEHTVLLRPGCKEVISRGDDY